MPAAYVSSWWFPPTSQWSYSHAGTISARFACSLMARKRKMSISWNFRRAPFAGWRSLTMPKTEIWWNWFVVTLRTNNCLKKNKKKKLRKPKTTTPSPNSEPGAKSSIAREYAWVHNYQNTAKTKRSSTRWSKNYTTKKSATKSRWMPWNSKQDW